MPPPSAHLDAPIDQLQELSDLRHLAVSLRTQLEISRQVSELSMEIVTFDTSAPGWTKGMRVISYLLALPAFAFGAPVFSGNSLAVSAITPFGLTDLTPTFNTVGLVLAIVAGVTFALGVTGGIVGWLLKSWELDSLIQQKAALNEQWAALRTEGQSFANR